MGIYIAANVPWVPGLFPVGKTAGGWLRLTHPVLVLRLCVGRAVPVSSLCAFMPLSRVTFTLPVYSIINSLPTTERRRVPRRAIQHSWSVQIPVLETHRWAMTRKT